MRNNAFYLAPVALFEKTGIKPIVLTLTGAIITSASGYFFASGDFLPAGIIMAIGSILDLFDGELARRTDQVTRFGGFIDSTLDRLSEFAIFLGLFLHYQGRMEIIVLATLFATQMVSYTRARAEGVGWSCRGGILTRGMRVILLFIGAMLGSYYMRYIIGIILIGSVVTFLQRIWIARAQRD
ncbi:MAG TPA: CDP-alcohol phosphatidyltransferase family protein [bacterium (Candidatus Stahlbacteria)]|nr:CDP-alcohol phosphatidyltransferase family protein [Candidatus Stahlbacteria bacterium]